MTSSETADLLTVAAIYLDATTGDSARTACWCTRRALEQIVDELLLQDGWQCSAAAMSSRLTALRVTHPDASEQAAHAWDALSQASHQHAFRLDPTVTEVRGWWASVKALSEAAPQTQ